MTNPLTLEIDYFDRTYGSWKAGIVHVVVHYVAIRAAGSWLLLTARVELSPFELLVDTNEVVATSEIRVGQIRARVTADELDGFTSKVKQGSLVLLDVAYALPDAGRLSQYAPKPLSEPEYFASRLEVRSDHQTMLIQRFDYEQANAELRCGPVPFDGLTDLLSFFGFGSDGRLPHDPQISLTIHPPCDLKLEGCSLSQNKLRLRLIRRLSLGRTQMSIGLRQFPNPTLARRMQIGGHTAWQEQSGGFEVGTLELDLDDCATAELMLSFDGFSVRRCFLFDPRKSLNPRLTDYRNFDPDLHQLRRSLAATRDGSRNLEVGVAVLLYLIGATTVNPPSTDTPDVIVETPGRRVALVECTIRVDNIREKVGKLVHRREGLLAAERKHGLTRDVMAVLVVNQPSIAIVKEQQYLQDNQVVLLTLEDIDSALNHLEVPQDVDKWYLNRMEAMRSQQGTLFGNL